MTPTKPVSRGARELAAKIYSVDPQFAGNENANRAAAMIDSELRELLAGVEKAVVQLYNAAYQDEVQHHRQSNKLCALLTKWKVEG